MAAAGRGGAIAKRALAASPATDSAQSRYLGSSRATLIRQRGVALTLTLACNRAVGCRAISALEPELAARRRLSARFGRGVRGGRRSRVDPAWQIRAPGAPRGPVATNDQSSAANGSCFARIDGVRAATMAGGWPTTAVSTTQRLGGWSQRCRSRRCAGRCAQSGWPGADARQGDGANDRPDHAGQGGDPGQSAQPGLS
jgi:hypothetical protein